MKSRSFAAVFLWSLWTAAPALAQNEICIPQFVDGVVGPFRWQTTLVLHNQDRTPAQMQLHFYNNNGQPMAGMTMRGNGGRGPHNQLGPGGQFGPNPVNPGAMVGYRSNGQGPVQAGSVLIQSPNRIQAHAMLHLMDASGNTVSEAGVTPQPPFRAGSFYMDHSGGADVGGSFSNPSPAQPVNCTLEIFGEDGITPLGTAQLSMGPRTQTARLMREIFPGILTDGIGFIRVTCDNPICPLALHLRGFAMTQIPIIVEQ